MIVRISARFPSTLAVAVCCSMTMMDQASAQWPQWGGPDRNFVVATTGLADSWPEGGPQKLWHRELGDGYSAMVVDGGVLYTMYGADEAEITVALDATTGKTVWEHKNPSPFKGTEFGPGPHSTPALSGDRIFAVGANAVMHCFDKKTGKVLWKHDLADEFGAPIPQFGYACSPVVYKNTVIIPVDRTRPAQPSGSSSGETIKTDPPEKIDGQSLIAFDQATGGVAWKSQDFAIDYSSPIIINFAGEDQLVLVMRNEIIGVNPTDGRLLWRHSLGQVPLENIATPLWNGEDRLFLSAAYNSGSRLVKLTRKEGKTVPQEQWYSRKLRVHHGNALWVGDYIYGSSGDSGSILFVALDADTGQRVWADRNLGKSTCIHADGKLIALEEHGDLVLATVTPDGLTIHSRCKITDHQSWTAPTLVGKTLYVRDRKHMMALDLG